MSAFSYGAAERRRTCNAGLSAVALGWDQRQSGSASAELTAFEKTTLDSNLRTALVTVVLKMEMPRVPC